MKEPAFGTKDFGNGAWGQLNILKGQEVKEAWDLLRGRVERFGAGDHRNKSLRQAFDIIDNAIRKEQS